MRALLAFLFFLLFFLTARWFFVCEVLGECTSEVPIIRSATLVVRDTNGQILRGFQEFGFNKDSAAPILSRNNRLFLDSLTEYLLQDPKTTLLITSFYEESEMGLSEGRFENLGLARADRIRQQFVQRGLPEEKIYLDYFLSDSTSKYRPVHFQVGHPPNWGKPIHPERYTLVDMTYSGVNFPINGESYLPSLAFESYTRQLKAYIAGHSIEKIRITGHSIAGETDQDCARLGLALAESARNQLAELAVTLPVEVESMGNNRLLVPLDSPQSAEKNDRVTFELTPQTR